MATRRELFKEIEGLREANARLKDEAEALIRKNLCFEAVLDEMPDGFIVVARDGTIEYINDAYCYHFGVQRKDTIGIPVERLIPNTMLIAIMENDLTQVDVLHEYPPGLTVSGEQKVVSTRMPVKRNGEIIASAALTKFSRYTFKLLQSIHALEDEVEFYRKELSRHSDTQQTFSTILTSNQEFRSVKALAERFAKSDLPILLRGETGVGKEVFAKAIHLASDRRDGPFICLNCTSIPGELLESELFGYEGGAFTGSRKSGQKGKFELAHKGTLFLDEIGDMPLSMQVKLLRVLQNGIIEKIGGENRHVDVDVRILSATNQPLEQKIDEKSFREDLYYRLNVLPIVIPPLRSRPEDIPSLTYAFLEELNNKYEPHRSVAPETLVYLQRYSWHGNIRELRNVIARSFMTTYKSVIEPEDLPPHLLLEADSNRLQPGQQNDALGTREKDSILSILRKYGCNCSRAAKELGIHRATLYNKLEKHNVDIAQLRMSPSFLSS
jgi:PAS domain S-box-containing protein